LRANSLIKTADPLPETKLLSFGFDKPPLEHDVRSMSEAKIANFFIWLVTNVLPAPRKKRLKSFPHHLNEN
jgi:hypothetical protein